MGELLGGADTAHRNVLGNLAQAFLAKAFGARAANGAGGDDIRGNPKRCELDSQSSRQTGNGGGSGRIIGWRDWDSRAPGERGNIDDPSILVALHRRDDFPR